MGNEIREKLRAGLRETFESMPPEMWCAVSVIMFAEVKDLCVEYYEKGLEELRKRWDSLLEFIGMQRSEEE